MISQANLQQPLSGNKAMDEEYSRTLQMSQISIVILAAGQGTRMRSSVPKVLQPLAGKALLSWVLETAQLISSRLFVVVGHQKEQLQAAIQTPVTWITQDKQLGTAHALKMALPYIPDTGQTLVLYGDVPLIEETSLRNLLHIASQTSLGLLTDTVDNPTGYGRIVRDEFGEILGIVEEKDATQTQKSICEVNTGIYVIPNVHVHDWIARVDKRNMQQEYYLTDLVALACQDGVKIITQKVKEHHWVAGVNDKQQLAALERVWQYHQAQKLLQQGVTLLDPSRFDLRGQLRCGRDVLIDINAVFTGDNVLEDGVTIGANCVLHNVTIHRGAYVAPFCHLQDCEIGEAARVGPFARLRPGTVLEKSARAGNFVEIKKSTIATGSKVNHLTYIGDSYVGKDSNIGAGCVTCNYDGVHKYTTYIGEDCFIGSGVLMVAPVTINNGATVGAGSVITKDCPERTLSLSRSKQITIPGWKRPNKED